MRTAWPGLDADHPAPRRGNGFFRALAAALLRLFGWRWSGEFPRLTKFVAIGAPHTSNWDFVVALCAVLTLQLDARWIGKHTLFEGRAGKLFRWLGGRPVDRANRTGAVQRIVDEIEASDKFVLCMSPEGTRGRTDRWRTGFYHIAVAAKIPIVMMGIDFGSKQIRVLGILEPTGDLEADLPKLYAAYSPSMAKYPDRYKTPQV